MRPRRCFVVTAEGDHDGPIFPNLAKGMVSAGPDQLWVADLTYIRVLDGFVHLAVIPGRLVAPGGGPGRRPPYRRRPPGTRGTGGGHRGSTAASRLYLPLRPRLAVRCRAVAGPHREKLTAHGLKGSMGRRDNPYGNAEAESFTKTLKHEEVHPGGYKTFADIAARPPRFLEEVYNGKRLHSALGYLSPTRFEEVDAREAA